MPIDGLRGLAILLVIGHHSFDPVYGYGYALDTIFAALSLGWVGVDLFFAISGFLITGILIDSKPSEKYFRNFYARRFFRIFPLYYLFCFLAIFIVPGWPCANPATFETIQTNQAWLWFYAANILIAMKHSWLLISNCLELNHLWSLAVEEHFYLIWPFIVWFSSSRQLKFIALAVIATVLMARVAYFVSTNDYISAYILTPFRIDALLIGALPAIFRSEIATEKFKTFSQISLVGSFLLLVVSFKFFDWRLSGFFAPAIGLTLLPIFFSSLIMHVVSNNGSNRLTTIFSSRILSFFGKYSYGLYIYHFPVLKILGALGVGAYFAAITKISLASVLLFNTSAFVVAIVVAMLSWHLWEKHFLRLKRYFSSSA